MQREERENGRSVQRPSVLERLLTQPEKQLVDDQTRTGPDPCASIASVTVLSLESTTTSDLHLSRNT